MNIDKYEKTIYEWRFSPMANYMCPTYKVTKNESNSPRGLALLLYLISKGKRNYSMDLSEKLYQCSSCFLCTDHSYDDTDPASLFIAARSDAVKLNLIPDAVKNFIKLQSFPNKSNNFSERNKNIETDLAVFINLNSYNNHFNEINDNLEILNKANLKYKVFGMENGSGASLFELGFWENAKEIAAANLLNLEKNKIKKLVCMSPYDYRAFTEWFPELGVDFNSKFEITALPKLFLDLVNAKKIKFKNADFKIITYHNSANFVRAKNSFLDIEGILNKIPDIKYVPMSENEKRAYCDGGDFLRFVYPEIQKNISQKRMQDAVRTGANILLTSCFYAMDNLNSVNNLIDLKIFDLGHFMLTRIV